MHVSCNCVGRLGQQYVVDQYAKIQQSNCNYLRENQSTLRAAEYTCVMNPVGPDGVPVSRRIILPATHAGSPRDMRQK